MFSCLDVRVNALQFDLADLKVCGKWNTFFLPKYVNLVGKWSLPCMLGPTSQSQGGNEL